MNERGAGILLHITSLPSEFGIGDLGPEAYSFANLLLACQQKIWQILPLNPVDGSTNYSPYSSISSAAGNTLLISPELLVQDGLLKADDIDQFLISNTGSVNFVEVERMREVLFDQVWKNFKQKKEGRAGKEFKKFCLEEEWLDDFALYCVIKKEEGGKPWFQWSDELKHRDSGSLKRIIKQEVESMDKVKFLQFIFSSQWQRLKSYCNKRSINLFGDLPFYVSHDSVDVWTNPEIFKLDDEGNLLSIAGTPPDMFSKNGQLWNLPVYRWKSLKKSNYNWWAERMKRNKRLLDLIRLDHFRAFSAYWEVPAESETSKNGSWKPSPGKDLFKMIRRKLGDLPFVAEDLGDIDDAVIKLRDEIGLPGMKVLQFAFGENMADSEHIPHNYDKNYFVFTGTHDNNTTRGWYGKDIDEEERKRIQQYCAKILTEENIAGEFIRLAYASVAKTAIIPMQDILNLDESARMNTPASNGNNWRWRLMDNQVTDETKYKLKEWVSLYRR